MWILLGLACALLHGSSDALSKRLLVKSNEWVVAWATLLFALPWMLPALLWGGLPALPPAFWGIVALMIPLELTAYLCYLRAIRISPLSLVVPFLALTPLLTIFTGWLLLGERISGFGFAGVAAVTAGAYILQAELVPQGLLEPIKAMGRSRGIRLILATASLYSITVVFGKKAAALAGPAAFPPLYFGLETAVLFPLAAAAARRGEGEKPAAGRGLQPNKLFRAVREQWPLFALTGAVLAMSLTAHFFGILMAPVPYFLALKRLSLLVSVLYGGLLFREAAFAQRMLGAALMVLGAVLVTLPGPVVE